MNKLRLIPFMVLSIFLLGMSSQPSLDRSARPDQRKAYLELGEQLVALAQNDQDLRLARTVLGMGVMVNFQRNDPSAAASCSVALAWAFKDDPSMQRRLWDLTLQLDPERFPQWAQYRPGTQTTIPMKEAAECLRRARNADADGASGLYRRTMVRETIARISKDLGYTQDELDRTLGPMFEGITRDPCRGNYFYTDVENGESVRKICDSHAAPLGTTQSTQTLIMLLRIEAACLNADESMDDWGSAYMLGSTAPSHPASIEWLIDALGLDPARPYLRNGVWSESP